MSNKRGISMTFTPRNVARPGMGRGIGAGRGRGIGSAGRGNAIPAFNNEDDSSTPNQVSAVDGLSSSTETTKAAEEKGNIENQENQITQIDDSKDMSPCVDIDIDCPPVKDINDYELLDQLGKGEFGVVRRAKSKKTKIENGTASNTDLCIKELKFEFKDGFPLEAIREVTLLNHCAHGNIVKLLDVCCSDGSSSSSSSSSSSLPSWYLVMEAVDMDLYSLVLGAKQFPFSESQVKDLVFQLFSAIEAMHNKKVMHRDIKPANCLISKTGILKLCDFGLARKFEDKDNAEQGGESEDGFGLSAFTHGVATYSPPPLPSATTTLPSSSFMNRNASITMINDILAEHEDKEDDAIQTLSEEANEVNQGSEESGKEDCMDDALAEQEKKFEDSFFTEVVTNKKSSNDGTHTPRVVSGHYRPPEVLCGSREYDCTVDIWSAGCIFAELILRRILFEGSSEEDQLIKILRCLGEPLNSETYEKLKNKSGFRMKHDAASSMHAASVKTALEGWEKAKADLEEALRREAESAQEVENSTPDGSTEPAESTDIFDPTALEQARLSAAHKVATQKVKAAKWAVKRSAEGLQQARFASLRNLLPREGYDPRNVHADPSIPCSLSDVGFKELCSCLEVDPTVRCSASQVLSSGWFQESPPIARIDSAAISIAKRAADSAKRTAEKVKMMSSFNQGFGAPSTMSGAAQAAANAAHMLRTQGFISSGMPPNYPNMLGTVNTGPPMPPALAMAFAQGPPSLSPPAPSQAQLQAKEIAMAQARAQAKLIAQQHSKK